ncbi:hypothetical protein V8C44DRAFT_342887 [Trichoderma aethiopicum]
MADTSEGEDLLYNLAYECEALFDPLQDTLQKTESSDGLVQLCSEFQQRFAIWAAHLGVFARKSQCLDTRLRNIPDLQDLVARLLDILRRSLQQCTAGPLIQGENDEITMGIHELPSGAPQIQIAHLKTIDDTLTRLNRVGVTIRQSGRGKLDTRAERFAAGLDLSSFAHLCANAVQALYPGAHQSLKDHLTSSMTDRYARMLFLDSRHLNLQARRDRHVGLPPIQEVPSNEMPPSGPSLQPRMTVKNRAVQKLSRQPLALSQSDFSSVSLQQIRSPLRPPDEASTKFHKTSSIEVNQGNYPRIPATTDGSTIITCQLCSEPLSKKTLSESDWRRHIDRDLKPYICLSEACPDAHPAYATFDEWYKHMKFHDWRWHQRTYLTSSWVCTICESGSGTYTSPQALYLHLEDLHGRDFTHAQLQAISRQSKTEQPRVSDDCLLCCFAVEEQGNFSQAVFAKRRKGQTRQKTSKSTRKTLEMAHPSPHDSGSELSDTSSSSDDMGSGHRKQRSEGRLMAVSRHVAVHLQMLMLLTLRFAAALQDDDGGLGDDVGSNSVDIDEGNSASGGTDLGRLSSIASDEDITMKNEDGERNTGGDMDSVQGLSDDITADDMPVPDTDIDLKFIPKQYDNLAVEDDIFLNELIESGDFLYGEDVSKEFSISRAIMAATQVALATVNIIDGVSFELPNDDDGNGDDAALPSDIGNHMNDTSHDLKTTEQLPDNSGKTIQPEIDSPGRGARSTTMGDSYVDDDMGTIEGAQFPEGVTIADRIIGNGRLVKKGDIVRVSRHAIFQNGEGFHAAWTVETSVCFVVGEHYLVTQSDGIFPGWDHGIIGMAVGGERRLTIPAHLAEVKDMLGIPSNCQLILDIRLLHISGESFEEADPFGYRADFDLWAGQDRPSKEAFASETDRYRSGLPPPFRDYAEPQTTTERNVAEFVEAHNPAGMGKWLHETPLVQSGLFPRELSPTEADIARKKWGFVNESENRIRDAATTSASAGLRPFYRKATGKPESQGSLGTKATASSEGSKTLYSHPIDLPHQEVAATPATRNVKKPRLVKSCVECRRRKLRCDRLFPCSRCIQSNLHCRYAPDQKSAKLSNGADAEGAEPGRPSLNLAFRPAPDQPPEHSGWESHRLDFELGPGVEALQDEGLPKTKGEPNYKNPWGAYARSLGNRVGEPYSSLAFGEETRWMGKYSRAVNWNSASSTRPLHELKTPPYKPADAEEDSPPRLKRVGHVQFDGFAGMGAHPPSNSNDAASEGATAAGYPLSSSSANATGDLEVGTPSRGLAKSGNPFRNPFGEGEDPVVSETEKHMCTFPGCGKTASDPWAHSRTHLLGLEKCPFTTCLYHTTLGFDGRHARNRHLFTHHNGIMLCGFCPGSSPGLENTFDHLDAFKKHLSAVHGVEQTPPDGRRAVGFGYMAPETLAHGPDATGICSICNMFFTDVQNFYWHLDSCVTCTIRLTHLGAVPPLVWPQSPNQPDDQRIRDSVSLFSLQAPTAHGHPHSRPATPPHAPSSYSAVGGPDIFGTWSWGRASDRARRSGP